MRADAGRAPLPPGRFASILLDAPCSGTGTLRKNPEIRLRLRPEDLAGFAETQRRLLAAALDLVAPGGTLVYVTCSLEREENEDVVDALLGARPEFARVVPDGGGPPRAARGCRLARRASCASCRERRTTAFRRSCFVANLCVDKGPGPSLHCRRFPTTAKARRRIPMAGKADIVDAIANDTGLTRKDATAALDSVVNAITGNLKKGERVAIPGSRRLPRGRPQGARRVNPRTKAAIRIAAAKVARFRAGKDLKDLLNKRRK